MKKKAAQRITKQLKEGIIAPEQAEAAKEHAERIEGLKDEIRSVIDRVNAFYASPERNSICELFPDFDEWFTQADMINHNLRRVLYFLDLFDSVKPILPAILAAAKELKQQPNMQDLTFAEFMRERKDQGSHFLRIVQQIKEQDAAAAETIETLPKLETFTVKHYFSPNNKLSNQMTTGIINLPAFDLETIHKKDGQKEVLSVVAVTMDAEAEKDLTFTGREYTQFDRAIHDIIVSIYRECIKRHISPIYITPLQIYHALTNYASSGASPSPQRIASIVKSIEKMRRIHVKVDATAEALKRKITDTEGKPVKKFEFGEFLLTLRDAAITSGGKTVKGYILLSEPVLHYYSSVIGNQILSAPLAMLNITDETGASIPNTDSRIAIKTYLLRRVSVMVHDEQDAAEALRKYNVRRTHDETQEEKPLAAFRKQSRIILFETLFKETGQETTDRRTQKNNRDYCFQVLECWKRSGDIADYKEQRKGKAITGIEIKVRAD